MQCSHSVTLLWEPQEHLSWTALAWWGRQKPADWGLAAQRSPHWKQSPKTSGPAQVLCGCSLTNNCTLIVLFHWTGTHSPSWMNWTGWQAAIEWSTPPPAGSVTYGRDSRETHRWRGRGKNWQHRETERRQSNSEGVEKCGGVLWEDRGCEEWTGCLGNVSGKMRSWRLVDYEKKVTYTLLGPVGCRIRQYHSGPQKTQIERQTVKEKERKRKRTTMTKITHS